MNQARAKLIGSISDELGLIKTRLEAIRDEEQEYFDNLSEKQQEGDKGEASAEAVNSLDEAIGNVNTAISDLGEIGIE